MLIDTAPSVAAAEQNWAFTATHLNTTASTMLNLLSFVQFFLVDHPQNAHNQKVLF